MHPQVELVELFLFNLAGCFGQEALTSLGFGESDDVPDIIRAGEQHNEPVEAEGYSAVGRRAVFEGLEEEAEPKLGLLP